MHKSNKVVTTTMLSRFQDALTLLCGERPDESLCREWMQDVNDDLQGWVLHHISPITPWATGIGTIDAAWAMASEPEEGKAMTKNTTVTLDEAVANSAALAEQWMQDFNDELQEWVLHHV